MDPHRPTGCNNPDVLIKVWTILSGLLGPDGKSVRVPDADQIKYALTLIKKYLQENSDKDPATSIKLQNLEDELAQNNDIILNDKRPLRTLLGADPVKNDLSSNMLFRYDLPSSIKPSCKAAFLNLIGLAQEAYVNMAKSPICTNANGEPLVPNTGGFTYYVPFAGLYQNPYNSPLTNPNEEALKIMEYLKDPANYNVNNVYKLLQKLHNPYSQVTNKDNALNYNQNQAPNNGPSFDWNYIDAINHSPLHGDFNINLEHAKDIANKLNAQNMFKNVKPDATDINQIETKIETTNLPNLNKQPSQGELQEPHYIPLENGNNDNINAVINLQKPQNSWYQPPPIGYTYFNPFQNHGTIGINEKIKSLEFRNNGGDNFNTNNYYPGGFNYKNNKIENIYPHTLANENNPIVFPWAYKGNYNLVLDKQPHDVNGVTNGAKLETNTNPKGQVELTYLLKRKRPLIYQPFYFVKYRLPYNYFIQNLKQMLSLVPDLSTPPTELYKGLIAPSNATEVSPDLASYPKEEIHNLVLKDGALVKAKYIEPNRTDDSDRKRDPERGSSEVLFEGIEHKTEKNNAVDGLNSNQNEFNSPLSNVADLNIQELNDALKTHNSNQLRQENQNLANVLAALGLQKVPDKGPNLAAPSQSNHQNNGNPASDHQETPVQNLENQPSFPDHLYSPLEASNTLDSRYVADTYGDKKDPYIDSQAKSSHKIPPYILGIPYQQATNLGKLGHQSDRPQYLNLPPYKLSNPANPVDSIQPAYILGTQAALGLNNKLLGNSLTNNNFYKRQTRRILGGYLPFNQYGYNRPGLYPNVAGNSYFNLLGNQGILGQPGLGNQLDSGLGLGQTSLYMQPPFYG